MTSFNYTTGGDEGRLLLWDYRRGFRIYRNLHKQCYSVQAWSVAKKGWRVWAHADSLVAVGCTFKVSKAGRERVLATGRKNVHAFIYAADVVPDTLARATSDGTQPRYSVPIRYNPYIAGYFHFTSNNALLRPWRDGQYIPVTKAWRVWLTEDGKMLGRRLRNPHRDAS